MILSFSILLRQILSSNSIAKRLLLSSASKNKKTEIWGVLNITPDSFYQASRAGSNFIDTATKMLRAGADKLDIGAESSRPFSEPVSAEEEWARLEPPLTSLKQHLTPQEFSSIVSIDTYKAITARRALELGVRIINDISAGADTGMFEAVAEYKAAIVLMHAGGTPQTMQVDPQYSDVIKEVFNYLEERSRLALTAGIEKENIIWDAGIGFGKTVNHNVALIKNARTFLNSGYPVMYGISRKSFIGKILGLTDPAERLTGTIAVHVYLALQGVSILRVHDITESVQTVKMVQAIQETRVDI